VIRVAVVGAGVVGKRVIDALAGHPALRLAGAVVRRPNPFVLARPSLPWYAYDSAAEAAMTEAGVPVRGGLAALLAEAEIVLDCGPARSGAGRAARYHRAGRTAVFCGGERDPRLGPLVHPALNADTVPGRTGLRLASCNTTALARVVGALGAHRVAELDATVVRCATDTDKAGKGITEGAVLSPGLSHHAGDLRAIVPGLSATSAAMTAPMTSGHVIRLRIDLCGLDATAAMAALGTEPRIEVADASTAFSTAVHKSLVDEPWHRRYRVVLTPVAPVGDRLDLWLHLDNQSVTVPEALDVLQLAGGGTTAGEARRRTDHALGIAADTELADTELSDTELAETAVLS